MLLTALLFTAIIISVFNVALTGMAAFQQKHLLLATCGYFLSLSIIFIEHLIEYSGYSESLPHSIFISAPFYLFLFPFLNTILKSLFGEELLFKKLMIELLPGIAYTFLMMPFYLFSGDIKYQYLSNFVVENWAGSYKHIILIAILLLQTLFYSISWYASKKRYLKEIKQSTSAAEIESIPWFLRMVAVIVLFTSIIILSWLSRAFWPGHYYLIEKVGNAVLATIPGIYLFLLFFLPKNPFPGLSNTPKTRESLHSPDEEKILLLTQLMQDRKLYLDPDLNLSQVSEVMGISRHELSALLKEGFQQTFYELVNNYRIQHATTLLNDDEMMKKFSLSGIARESGFNSYVSFYRVFKRLTKMTPSQYLEQNSPSNRQNA